MAEVVLVARVLAIVAVTTAVVRADPTDRCIADSEAGQRLLLTRHFVEARPHLLACGAADCPAPIARDCAERARQADASIATAIATSDADTRLRVDGAPAELGVAIALDPGTHHFVFERDGRRIDRAVDLDEGAHMQRVVATFGIAKPHTIAGQLVVGGGLAGIAAGAVLGLIARSDRDAERAACASATDCTDYATAERDYHAASNAATASTICFATGAALVAAGVAIWFVTRERAIAVAPSPAGVNVVGRF